ncbi:sulfurtransferase [Woeseia oceani]|nr:sulfurtransferase [Woeseia oceani]
MNPLHMYCTLAVTFLLTGCNGPVPNEMTPPMDTLVSAGWLSQHYQDSDLVILDATVMIERTDDGGMRTVNGRENFNKGHIPGARFADLMGELVDSDSPLHYAVPEPGEFAAAMERLGVGDNSRVVIYDANGSAWAARVWWMLRWIGFDNAALLDGGLQAWTDAGQSLSTESVAVVKGSLTVNLRPELIVASDEVHAAIGDDSVTIIDSLPAAHYRGEFSMYERPGHIPGASNVSVMSLTNDDGHFKTVDELATLFDGDYEGRAITYCGGGIAASANAFTMIRLGYKDVAVYTASLQEWAADPARPMETE